MTSEATSPRAGRTAVADGEDVLDAACVEVHYQPCYDLRTHEMVAVEALARLRDPRTGEVLEPDRFLPGMESTGRVAQLDELVLALAVGEVVRWRALPGGERLCLAVNLSTADLDDVDLPDRIVETLARAGLPADALIIELTETLLSRTGQGHEHVMQRLAQAGCNVTLDDFGTGNATFDYLRRFPVDGIKVDRSFVQFLGSGGPHERMAESMLRFCLSLGIHVVAEGVERPEQVAALRRLGCPFAQGYLLSRPVPAEELTALLVAGGQQAHRFPDPAPVAARGPARLTRWVRKWERRATRVLAVLIALAFVTLVGLVAASRSHNDSSLVAAAMSQLEAIDGLAARQIDSQIGGLRDVVTAYSRSDDVRRALADRRPGSMRSALLALKSSSASGMYSASLYDADGTLLALEPTAPSVIGQNFSYRDWYVGALAAPGAYVAEAIQLVRDDKPWSLVVSAAVRDEQGRVQGFVVASLVLAELQDQLGDLVEQYGVAATLVDGHGTTLASPVDEVGSVNTDARLRGRAESRTGDDTLWVVREVPALGGWLLVERPRSAATALVSSSDDVSLALTFGAVAIGLAGLLLWVIADGRRRRLKIALVRSNLWLSSVMEATPTPLVISDDQDLIVMANPEAAALLGVPGASLEGQPLSSWLSTRDEVVDAEGLFQASLVTRDGEIRVVEGRTRPLVSPDGPEGKEMLLHALIDVTPHRLEQARLRAEGRVDPLTGVDNRIGLNESLAAALSPGASPHALVMMDLDGFKAVNDRFGHAVGDDVLRSVASTLVSAVRPHDTVARIGGDEFALVLLLDEPDRRDLVSESLRALVQAALDAHPCSQQVRAGVSVGAVTIGTDGDDPSTLLEAADALMYAAKRQGRRRGTRVTSR